MFQAIRSCAQSNVIPQPHSVSVLSQCDDDQTCGDYGELYTTLQQIGKGAFGYVKMAFRNEDGLLVCISMNQKVLFSTYSSRKCSFCNSNYVSYSLLLDRHLKIALFCIQQFNHIPMEQLSCSLCLYICSQSKTAKWIFMRLDNGEFC